MRYSSVEAPHGFVGNSPPICKVRRQIDQIGNSRSPVLLIGESGTGKEVTARALFNRNPRGSFVPIDCGSLVGPLMESELFGHVRGAFTGAHDNKRGLIESANGGTAFFDEIGDLPLELQVKLLRLLQEREYRPVGGLTRQKVDLRIIAATHRDLTEAVAKGTFREDLYYRLNVIKIRIPALRDRKEDILELAKSFLQRHGDFEIPLELANLLVEYPWPGNVRELQNCMDRLATFSSEAMLGTRHLPSAIGNWSLQATTNISAMAQFASGDRVIPLRELEKQAILHAVQQTKGDRGTAATLLGIGRTTLYRKMKEYNLDVEVNARCNV